MSRWRGRYSSRGGGEGGEVPAVAGERGAGEGPGAGVAGGGAPHVNLGNGRKLKIVV